jgi:hypothetical protein
MQLGKKIARFSVQTENNAAVCCHGAVICRRAAVSFGLGRGCGSGTRALELLDRHSGWERGGNSFWNGLNRVGEEPCARTKGRKSLRVVCVLAVCDTCNLSVKVAKHRGYTLELIVSMLI